MATSNCKQYCKMHSSYFNVSKLAYATINITAWRRSGGGGGGDLSFSQIWFEKVFFPAIVLPKLFQHFPISLLWLEYKCWSWLIQNVNLTSATSMVPHVEQFLFTLPEHMISSPSWLCFMLLSYKYVLFCGKLIVCLFIIFPFGHCIVCLTSLWIFICPNGKFY